MEKTFNWNNFISLQTLSYFSLFNLILILLIYFFLYRKIKKSIKNFFTSKISYIFYKNIKKNQYFQIFSSIKNYFNNFFSIFSSSISSLSIYSVFSSLFKSKASSSISSSSSIYLLNLSNKKIYQIYENLTKFLIEKKKNSNFFYLFYHIFNYYKYLRVQVSNLESFSSKNDNLLLIYNEFSYCIKLLSYIFVNFISYFMLELSQYNSWLKLSNQEENDNQNIYEKMIIGRKNTKKSLLSLIFNKLSQLNNNNKWLYVIYYQKLLQINSEKSNKPFK